jgi:transcriptional regulator with XRE-family HTH domain
VAGKKLPILARRIKQFREAAGYSQQKLAVVAGLSTSVVSQLEQGTNDNPKTSTIRSLAAALGVTIDDLFREDESRPQ